MNPLDLRPTEVVLRCTVCGTEVHLPMVQNRGDRHPWVQIAPANGWTIDAENGARCPAHASSSGELDVW